MWCSQCAITKISFKSLYMVTYFNKNKVMFRVQ